MEMTHSIKEIRAVFIMEIMEQLAREDAHALEIFLDVVDPELVDWYHVSSELGEKGHDGLVHLYSEEFLERHWTHLIHSAFYGEHYVSDAFYEKHKKDF